MHNLFTFNTKKPFGRGFSFIEISMVLVVIAILGAIVYPRYREHLFRSERSQALVGLYQLQVWLEQKFTADQVYPNTLDCSSCKLSAQYTYTISATGDAYTLKATPKSGTTAYEDSRCHTYVIDEKQQRSNITGKGEIIAGNSTCWLL
ncbi:MAG: type IV pilin protein [Vibrionaceae bacterium]